ncbi:MAG: TonB-dependent receptor [Bacillati bacterium ANGP1]|uniref:TonB-dependent receptor n=1 Tax=Candidatus Segetimicrobium genomatis TaxID=2569760 RepID=A0A537JTD9_9BACT|nr:MAG: TonB-dependent receptor [Terrabacteria group bacterium ANGP1]
MARLPHGISARSASWTLLAPLLALIFTLVAGLPGRTQTPPAAPEPPPAAPPPAAPPAAPATPALPPTAPALPASPPPPPNAPAAPAAPTPPTFELPEVEVAGKRPQLPSTTPASVSVITAEEIARLGALSVADVLRILPEVRVKDSGGPGSFTSVSIRGSASTQVLILLDGVPLNRPDQASVDLSTLPIQNVERIEVLRGPFSAIYGSGALGGVINIVTRSAPQTALSSRAGSFGLTGNQLSVGGQAAGLTYLLQGIQNAGAGFVPDTDFSNFTGMARLRWSTAEDAGVTLTLNRFWHNVGTPGPLPPSSQDLLARTTEGRTLMDLSWRRGGADGPGALVRLYVLDDDVNFNSPGISFQSDDVANLWGAQGLLVSAPWPGNLLTLGAEYQGQNISHTDNSPSTFTNQGSDLAFYTEDDWQITPGLLLSLGVRNDNFQLYGSQVSPRFGVVVLLSDRLALRAGAGRTFRAPSFDELAPSFGGNPALQPEIALSDDLGFEYTLAPGLAVILTGYYTDATNLITSTGPPLFSPMNVGHAIVTGGSIELAGRLDDRWFVRANLTNQLARDAATGLDVIYIPRQQGNVEVSYQWAPGDAVTAVVSYVGNRFANTANSQPVPGYWLIGLNAAWALGDAFALQAGVNNLLDVRYQESLNFPEPGRTVYVGLSKTF